MRTICRRVARPSFPIVITRTDKNDVLPAASPAILIEVASELFMPSFLGRRSSLLSSSAAVPKFLKSD